MAFIVFEGGEGVGKTTQLERVHNLLNKHKIAVLKTREPGGTPLAEKIRNLFKEKGDVAPLPLTEICMLSAARNEHVKRVIEPALQKEQIVLCDRFLDSTYVYQCVVGGISKEAVDKVSELIIGSLLPNITFVFYCDVDTAQSRIKQESARALDRYDSADVSLKRKILDGYKEIYDKNYTFPNGIVPKRILIDATQNVETIFHSIVKHLNEHCHLNLAP